MFGKMSVQSRLFYATIAIFLATLAASWLTHGRGIVRDDPERNIAIPDILLIPLELQVAYNDREIFFRYRWPAEAPHLTIDMLRYTDGQWVRHGRSAVGREPEGIYEDRVSMMVDDGSVREFQHYGGYITVGNRYRFMSNEVPAAEVRAHPHLGARLGASDLRKSLPATRSDGGDWSSVVDEETLAKQRAAGYFLDLWQWRAHRSNPLGFSDDQHIAEYRLNDSGRGPYFSNWDAETGRPLLMFNPEITGKYALDWEDVAANRWDFDAIYYLSEDMAAPFDPEHAWREGDTIPGQVLRQPQGSRGAVRVRSGPARWADGHWDLTLVRAMDTGFPLEDKIFRDQGVYDIAVAVHRDATGSRWHYVSLPYSLGLGREAEIHAHRFSGDTPDWDAAQRYTLELFYPGQVTWESLTARSHAGAAQVRAGVPVRSRHTPQQLAYYGVEQEFMREIRRQWLLTLIGGVLLIAAFGVAIANLLRRKRGDV